MKDSYISVFLFEFVMGGLDGCKFLLELLDLLILLVQRLFEHLGRSGGGGLTLGQIGELVGQFVADLTVVNSVISFLFERYLSI